MSVVKTETSIRLITLREYIESGIKLGMECLVPFGLQLYYITLVRKTAVQSDVWGEMYPVLVGNGSTKPIGQVSNLEVHLPASTGVYIVPAYMLKSLTDLRILRNSRHSSDLLLKAAGSLEIGDNVYSLEGMSYGTVIHIDTIYEGTEFGETWVLCQNLRGWHAPILTFGHKESIMTGNIEPFIKGQTE